MAVPTIYSKLISEYERMSPETQSLCQKSCEKLRLMVSGSMALPKTTMLKWKNISHHTLLERYGMTEIGMALSNPLKGERVPGHVGFPLPGVSVRIVDESTGKEIKEKEPPGELRVKGDTVFTKYWNNPEATTQTFDNEGWFKTGDICELTSRSGYKILGRASVDIIKSGGYKISALDIERELLQHQSIEECAVVGLPDVTWGEKIAVIIVQKKGSPPLSLEAVREWGKSKLAVYKLPTRLLVLDSIPRNAMGKVNKKELAKLFTSK